MLKSLFSLTLLLGLAAAAPSTEPPVVIELFTSQGCSSCPPADRLLATLARDPGVIAVSRPVTYWDRLGWKDTLAREENTRRQYAYAARFRRDGVYTPQAVVDGRYQTVGSDREALVALLATARRNARPLALALVDKGRAATIVGPSNALAHVDLLWIRSAAAVPVARGENGGRTLGYTNVVLGEQRLGSFSGAALTVALPTAPTGADRAVLIVQDPGPGAIRAALQWRVAGR